MKCRGENLILRGIFHVVKHFPLHFMLYRRNLDYFSNRVGSASSAQHFPARIQISHYLFFVKMIAASFNRGFIWRRSRYIYVGLRRGISVKLNWFLIEVWRTQKTSHRAEKFWVFLNLEPGQPWDYGLRRLGASSFPWASLEEGYRLGTGKDTGSGLGRIQARDWNGKGKKLRRLLIRELH